MDKIKLNYGVDFLMLIVFLVNALTGLVLYFFKIRPKETLIILHVYSGFILVILVILHFVLHWDWIVCMTKKFF